MDTETPITDQQALAALIGKTTCGCGDPEAALSLIHDLLRHFGDKMLAWDDVEPFSPEAKIIYARQQEELDALVSGRAQWLVLYQLDLLGLTEHGSSLPGWLTPGGERMLRILDADQFTDAEGERCYRALDPAIPFIPPRLDA